MSIQQKSNENNDLLSIKKNEEMKKIINKDLNNNVIFEENNNLNINNILDDAYSDEVNIITIGNKIISCNMIVTKTTILFIDPIKMIIRHSYHRNELKRISVSEINSNLVAFHFAEKDDLIIETLRRFKMLNYFKKKSLGIQHIKINCTDSFKLEFYNSSVNFGKISLNRKSNINNKKQYYYVIPTNKIHLLPNFEEAIKFGYINKLSSNFGFKKFVLRFCVLTNIGLFIFESPNKNPKYLISLVN